MYWILLSSVGIHLGKYDYKNVGESLGNVIPFSETILICFFEHHSPFSFIEKIDIVLHAIVQYSLVLLYYHHLPCVPLVV